MLNKIVHVECSAEGGSYCPRFTHANSCTSNRGVLYKNAMTPPSAKGAPFIQVTVDSPNQESTK